MTPGDARTFARAHGAVTPIVGTVLVLFIVMLAIAGIVYWGVPAIQGIQEHAEFQSVVNQFVELNADLKNLRDPQSTRLDTINLNRGAIQVVNGSRWVVIAVRDTTYVDWTLTGWELNTTAAIGMSNAPAPAGATYTLTRYAGGASAATSTCSATSCPLPAGNSIWQDAWRIRAEVSGSIKGDAWIFNMDRIRYVMKPESTLNRLYVEMGALIIQQGAALFLEDPPPTKDPVFTVTPPDTQFFFRMMELNGTTAVSGKGRFPILVNLKDNYGPTEGRPRFTDAVAVRIQVDDAFQADAAGLLEEAFCNYFNAKADFAAASACDGGNVNVVYNPPDDAAHNGGKFLFELNQAVVTALVRAA